MKNVRKKEGGSFKELMIVFDGCVGIKCEGNGDGNEIKSKLSIYFFSPP